MRLDTSIGTALGLKAHRVVTIEADEAAEELVVHLDRREYRRLHCGECGRGVVGCTRAVGRQVTARHARPGPCVRGPGARVGLERNRTPLPLI
jgi:hypothetical protein